MASSPSAYSHSTCTRDYLFRALYLRREMLLLATRDNTSAETSKAGAKGVTQTSAETSTDMTVHSSQDVLLLPPLYSVERLSLLPSTGEGQVIHQDLMLQPEHAWCGLVQVRVISSPWYGGCFAFRVYFPSRYPFEPPLIELTEPLRSHPLLREWRSQKVNEMSSAADSVPGVSSSAEQLDRASTRDSAARRIAPGRRLLVPFEDVYSTIDPMRVSVMTVLLRHMQRMFLPAEWPVSWLPSMEAGSCVGVTSADGVVNISLARRDVERRSVTREVLLLKPFEQYVGTEVMQHFLDTWKASVCSPGDGVTDTTVSDDAGWYTREVLPHLLHS